MQTHCWLILEEEGTTMKNESVLLDTSFFINLFKINGAFHENAKSYWKYFLEHGYELKISTIAIAEYCVRGVIEDLPLRNLKIEPFNFDHAKKAGEFARIIIDKREQDSLELPKRAVVINDVKMFAQADLDPSVKFYATADANGQKMYSLIKEKQPIRFDYLTIFTPVNVTFATLF